MTPISRRAFLRGTTLLAAGGAVGMVARRLVALDRSAEPFALSDTLRWLARGQAKRLGPPAIVAHGFCPTYDEDLADRLRVLWLEAEMPLIDGKRVLIKPNLLDQVEGRPATTAPEVIVALVDLARGLGAAEVVVGDGPAFRRDAEPVVRHIGLLQRLHDRGVRFIDLNYDDPRPVPTVEGWFPAHPFLWLPRHVREADWIISVPKMKTHHWTGVSLSMKNLFGLVPGCRYGWPKNLLHFNGIPFSILGLQQMLPNVVSVVDGITAMEGDGPLLGRAVQHGLLTVGRDPAAVDVSCAAAMGFSESDVPHLSLAIAMGVGRAHRIEKRGELPTDMQRRYERPPNHASRHPGVS